MPLSHTHAQVKGWRDWPAGQASIQMPLQQSWLLRQQASSPVSLMQHSMPVWQQVPPQQVPVQHTPAQQFWPLQQQAKSPPMRQGVALLQTNVCVVVIAGLPWQRWQSAQAWMQAR